MTINHYAARPNWNEKANEQLKKSLSLLELSFTHRLTIVEGIGNLKKNQVPILLTLPLNKPEIS